MTRSNLDGPVSSTVLPSPASYSRRRPKKTKHPSLPLVRLGIIGLLVLVVLAAAGWGINYAIREMCEWNWTTYVSDKGGFSVQVPQDAFSNPVSWTRQAELSKGLYRPYTFEGMSLVDGTVVGVFYFDLPPSSADPALDPALLERLIRLLECQYHDEVALTTERKILWGENFAFETVYERQKGSRTVPIYSRWIAVDRRVYEVAWMQNRHESTKASRARFWDSFQIVKGTGADSGR